MNQNFIRHIRTAKFIANLLDNKFGIGKFRFGIDPLLGLIPGIGDILPMLFSFYIIWLSSRLEIPSHVVSQMVKNIVADFVIGSIPLIGDIADFTYKASSKNFTLMIEHLPVEYRSLA